MIKFIKSYVYKKDVSTAYNSPSPGTQSHLIGQLSVAGIDQNLPR